MEIDVVIQSCQSLDIYDYSLGGYGGEEELKLSSNTCPWDTSTHLRARLTHTW